MKATDLEKILNELTSDKNGHIRGKGRAMDKIQSLHLAGIQSEYVEKDFVLWLQLNCNSSGHYWILKTDYPRDMLSWRSIDDIHNYWLKEVKGAKQ